MEDLNSINMINNEENKKTPEYDNNVFEFKGELISISTEVINVVLSEINERFKLEDFSLFETEKQVLDYFYYKEKASLESIDLNFKEDENQKQFLKSFVNEIIEEKYQINESLTDKRNKIDKKLNEIIEEIKKCKDINSYNLSRKYIKLFKSDKIPSFLEKKIFDAIEVLILINELNQKSEKQKPKSLDQKEDSKNELFMIYYLQLLNKESFPFEGGNKKILLDILLFSNLKDIYKNPRIKEFFINNCLEICKYLNYFEGITKFEETINNRKEYKYIEEDLKNTFKEYEINDFHLYIIASYFYLLINQLKDINIKENKVLKSDNYKNNLNNPLIIRILKNILNCFAKYCSNKEYSLDVYKSLLNYFDKYIIKEEKEDKINKQYEDEDIEKIIRKSPNYEFIEEFQVCQNKIRDAEIMNSLNPQLINNYINLIPLTKKRTSHTITILISGFLSQKDDIDTWEKFFNFDKDNSDYYWFKWPSSDILSFAVKAFIFIKKAADSFFWCYQKAECAGKILAIFLLNNEEFYDCQINLVGFSLGCQVVINCLKELNKFKNHKFMVNNILLMGGAAVIEESERDVWRNIFRDYVAGRIINCFSEYDDVLSYLFLTFMKKIPIGIKKLDIKDENKEYSYIENYDFSDIKLGHLEYRKKFEIILKRIKFFDWND